MKQQLLFLFIGAILSGNLFSVQAQNIRLELNPDLKNQMNITEDPAGVYSIETLGIDPWILTRPVGEVYNPAEVYIISFDYIAEGGLDDLQIFYGTPLSPARSVSFGSLSSTSTYKTFKAFMKYEASSWNAFYERFRFDFGKAAGQTIKVKNLELRAARPEEVIELDLDGNTRNQLSAEQLENGSYQITSQGTDPYIAAPIPITFDPEKVFVVSFDYISQSGLDDLQIFYGLPYSPERRSLFGSLNPANTPTNFTGIMKLSSSWNQSFDILRFDFGRSVGLDINVNNLVLREATNAEKKAFEVKEKATIELDVNLTSGGLNATQFADGSYVLNTSGNDPWIRSKPVAELYDIQESYIISFEYKAEETYNELEIFFGPPISGTQRMISPEIPAATEWATYTINPKLLVDNFQDSNWSVFRFDFGRNENVSKSISVRNIVIRKPTAAELEAELTSDKFLSQALNQQFVTYLNTSFSDSVSLVKVDSALVYVKGKVKDPSEELFLAEIEPHQYGFEQKDFNFVNPLSLEEGEFSVEVPRFAEKSDRQYDRLYSRWAVVKKTGDNTYSLTSNMQWAGDISAVAENNLIEEKSSTIKGLDGLTPSSLYNFQDLKDLDIKNMKINLLLNGVFSLNATSMSHEFNGKTYNINPNFVQNLDVRIKMLTENSMKSAFVLLIPISIDNEEVKRLFVHPDASLGLYSMANVATEEGTEYYAAIVDFLAQRYSRPDNQFGRLDQWIIHNEVDAHTSWTHAGQKPVELYTAIYDRSMRLVHYTIRKHNPTAKVFTTFTKHWNSKPVSPVNFKSRDILDVLGSLSKKEGDYEWGIGWHSYPTNLRNPKVWEDAPARTQFNYDTPEITPRNLEMIDAYVRQKDLLYNGKKVRTILLSENGFSSNSAENPEWNQTNQAAALAYFWKKTNKRLLSIENIQLHRWVDNANEGGLEFGLWTVKEGTFDGFEAKKEGYFVWEAAGTSREDAVFDPYKAVIGISDWSEIYQDVATEVTPYVVKLNIKDCGANLNELLVSFNGELKIPQEDGSLIFYNVASNVPQPYEVRKGDLILALDVLNVTKDTKVDIDLKYFERFTAKGNSPSEIQLEWEVAVAGLQGYVIEVKEENGSFKELGRVEANQSSYIHSGVVSGERYIYRIAGLLNKETLSCYSNEASVIAPFLIVDYKDGDKDKPDSNKIRPHLQIRNEAANDVDLSRATIRYWFTAEGDHGLIFKAEQSGFTGNLYLKGNFKKVEPALAGADHYIELSFEMGAVVSAQGKTGEIRTKIEKSNPSAFHEEDDYSYINIGNFIETKTVTVYWDGELIWGEEPGNAGEKNEQQEEQGNMLLAVYPNPTSQFTRIKWSGEIIQAGDFELVDYYYGTYPVKFQKEELDVLIVSLPSVKPGIYILKGSVNGQKVVHRILIE